MRILVSLIIGFLTAFYLSETLIRLGRKIGLKLCVNHTIPGLAAIFAGIASSFIYQIPTFQIISFSVIGAGCGLIAHHFLSTQYFLFETAEKNYVRRHQKGFERLLEIMPGAVLWLALTSPLWLSYTLPFAVAYLILIADAYWLFNAIRVGILILVGYKKMEWAKKQNWHKMLEKNFSSEWKDYYHLVLLPTYKEPLGVLTPAYNAVTSSDYPKDKIFMAVGFEERDNKEKIDETSKYLKKVEHKIGGIFTSIHPFGLPGEVPGQGSNKNWMVKNALRELRKKQIRPEQVIVTTLDADFVIHPGFLAGMLHKYLSTPEQERFHRSFTGAFLFLNNYWQTPTPMRLMATGGALWQLAEMVGSDKYINYSSMSMNLQAILNVGLWIPDKVNDDSGFYWKTYYKLKGDYKVIPHFLPISADAVQDENFIKTLQNQYLQIKRWVYGVEHTPLVVREYFKQDIDFWDKTDKLVFFFWGYLKWGFLALFISFAGMLIPLINPAYTSSVVSVNLPIVSSWMLTIAFIGLFATIYVHEKIVPPRPANWSILKKGWTYIHWTLMPIIIVTISTIPAIDAQTTLMLGKHLEFRVTNKTRIK